MTSKIMHCNMAIQRALVFMSPSNSVFAASYPGRQDQSYEWIAGSFMCDQLTLCVCVSRRVCVCVCVCVSSIMVSVPQNIKRRVINKKMEKWKN